MSDDDRRRMLARVAHDVGKHVARAACNIRPGEPAPPALVDMLARDLYALRGGARASQVLEESVARSGGSLDTEQSVRRCRALLREADALEAEVRAGVGDAVGRAAEIAREVHEVLRAATRAAAGDRA